MNNKKHTPHDPDQPTGLREKLWQLHVYVVQRCLERLQEGGKALTPAK